MIATQRCPIRLSRVLGILLAAAALSAPAASVSSLVFTNSPSNVTVTNWTLVPVNVIATTGGAPVIVSVTLNFRTQAPLCTNLWNSLPMAASGSPTNFVATIPRLPAGTVDYYASCVWVNDDGITTSTLVSATNTYTVGTTLDTSRNQDFESGWIYSGPYPNYMAYQAATGWTGISVRVWATNSVGGISGTNTLDFMGPAGAYVQSPWITGGVAYVTFATKIRFTGNDTGTLAVACTTDGVTWTTNANWIHPSATSVLYPSVAIGVDAPCMIRVLTPVAGSGVNNGQILLDNVAIAPPAAGLTLATNGISPATPQSMDTVTISCQATDLSTNEPTINRRVTVWYNSYDTNSTPAGWLNQTMTNTLAAPFQYAATLPSASAGSNVYYFTCAFDGYYYTNADKNASVTSAPASYVINQLNKSILQLGATMFDFGGVATNAAASTSLLVTNAGNVSLTVTNVTCAAPFSCLPVLPFSVSAGASASLTITFAPGATIVYTNLLTINSDATALATTNTVLLTGTGLVAETTTMLSFSGPTNGPKNTLLSYTAAASNNYNHALQYQFDWGDGTPWVWTNASVQSHAWTNATTYSVNARAGSASVTSSWYALPTVTLTNTRTIRLVGNYPGLLDCGSVATGSIVSVALSVCNDGVDTLSVTNITAPAPFGIASPVNFSVAMNGSTNVMVTFAPVTTNVFTNTLTVWCNALTGTNTIRLSGTGIVSEAITAPVLNGAASGQPGQPLSFWARAVDNYGSNIQYRFDWGNGVTSLWSSTVVSGTTYTNLNSWASPTSVLVRAQAQNPGNTNIISAWSLPLSVSIDYTRVLGLGSSSLSFGIAVTNTTTALSLAVTNSGTGPLIVSNVTGTPGFAASPTNFTLAVGVGSNITVTFTPTLLQGYAGTLTLVNNMTSGTNTVALAGTGVTFNAVIGLTGPTSGIISNTLSPYVVTVTNTWAEPLAYMFGWGDGQTSSWQAASSTSHVWSAAGTNAVQVRVQSTVHTNVISAWSSPLLVTIFGAPTVAFGTVTNGLPIPVTVTIGALPGTVSNVVFWYLPPNSSSTNLVPMTLVTNVSGLWVGSLPPLSAGNLSYYLQYMQAGAGLLYPSSGSYSFAITNYLGPVRQTGFEETWTVTGTYPNFNTWNASGWTGLYAHVYSTSSRRVVPPLDNSPFCIQLTENGGFVASPVSPAGIGTIYFQAGLIANGSGTISVQVSTNNGSNWIVLQTYTMTAAGNIWQDIAPAITLNLRVPAMVQIVQTAATVNQQIILDNIILSPPPTDVQITERLHNPGYPNSKDPVRVRCQTTDYAVSPPSENRRLSVIFHHETDPAGLWTTNSMYPTNSYYEGVIPAHLPGVMSYYFRCDFDGYYYSNTIITNATYPSENLSPSYLPDQRPGPVYATYPVPGSLPYGSPLPVIPTYTNKLFRSEDASMFLQTTPSSVAVAMDLVADDTWQALTLMNGITNLTWYFVGSQHYSNDATAFSSTNLNWGDTNQDFFNPPLGGTADLTTDLTTNALRATLVYNGFLVHRFITTNSNYLVKRAVFQDFNNWQADQNYFEKSVGLYAITTYTNDFSSWGTNGFPTDTRWKIEDFESETALNTPYVDSARITTHQWAYREATTISERTFQAPLFSAAHNQALQLNNYNNSFTAQGQVWNTSGALTEGIHNFAFRARLAQNDGRYAVYTRDLANLTNGSPWTSGYRVTNTVRAISMSPAYPSLSLILCYSRDLSNPFDLGSYYELRVTQVDAGVVADATVQLQLIRWSSGAPTTIYSQVSNTPLKLTDAIPLQFDVSWSNVSTTAIQFTGNISHSGTVMWNFQPIDTPALTIPYSGGLHGGLVGFLCSDAEAEVWAMNVFAGTNLNVGSQIPMVVWNAAGMNSGNWFFGGTRSDGLPWWQTNYAGSVAGYLTRPVPAIAPRLALSMIRTGTTGVRDPDLTYYTNVAAFGVTSFADTNISQAFNLWDQSYVMLQYTNGDLPVVVDDLTLDPWRAYTRGFTDYNFGAQATAGGVTFWDWTSTDQQYAWSQAGSPAGLADVHGWLIFEGLVVNSLGNNYASFDRSRANPALSQGIWSPVLSNGIGSISFQSYVASGTSVYRVEYTSPINPGAWVIQQTFTNTSADGYINDFVAVQQPNLSGRIRIVQLPGVYDGTGTNRIGGSSSGAILNIDNLVVRDFPPPDATTWTAYNCLIARAATNNYTLDPVNPINSRAFESSSNAFDHQTCYLNNSSSSNTLSSESLTADNPYVQTPQVGTGIGEIAFWYRAWDTNPAYVSIQVAPNASTPSGQWSNLVSFVVTNLTYQYFDLSTVFDTDDQVMRIYTQTNSAQYPNAGRLCIDNILMTEPVRAGYDITGVTLLPTQPLMTDQVGVQASIGRFLMNPQNIQLYLSYYKGTNVWGYANWRSRNLAPSDICVTIPMVQTQPNSTIYTTPAGSNIPAGNIDDVVQYIVWGTYSNLQGRPVFQDTNTFANPSWYYPVDLNPKNGSGDYLAPTNWSPYYYVYSCPPGSVWINELNYVVMQLQEKGDEYVELCGRVNSDISNWRIDVIDPLNNFAVYHNVVVPPATQIQEEYLTDGSGLLSSDGWGFWVWGGSYVYLPGPMAQYFDGVEWVPYQTSLPPNVQYTAEDTASLLVNPAGLRLVRSMGAYEERLCYGSSSINAELVAQGYTYVGAKHTLPPWPAPLQLQGTGTNAADFYWYQPSSYNNSPGAINTDQALLPLTTYYMLYSIIGAQGSSLPASPLVAVSVASGSSTTIVYTADSWYRIGSFLSNGASVPQASNQVAYTWSVTNISQSYSNNVTFSMLSTNTNNVPTPWLAGFGMSESTPFGHDAYSVAQEWLLNMNPYASNSLSFAVDGIAVTGATVNVTVKLLESTNGVAYNAQPSIYGTLYVQGTTNLVGGTWTPVASTQVAPPGVIFDTNGRKLFSFPADTNRFYRATVQ